MAPALSLPAPGRCRGGSPCSRAGEMGRLGWRALGVWGQGQLLAGESAGVMVSLWGVVASPGTRWVRQGQVLAPWPLFLHGGVRAVWPWTLGPSFLGMLGLAGPLRHLGWLWDPHSQDILFS